MIVADVQRAESAREIEVAVSVVVPQEDPLRPHVVLLAIELPQGVPQKPVDVAPVSGKHLGTRAATCLVDGQHEVRRGR